MRADPSDVARRRTEYRNRVPVILSADENSTILYNRYKVLQSAGYGVVSAIDGEQALSMFEAYPVDLVLLDYGMPGTDDETVTHRMKRCKQNVPVIAVSANPIPTKALTGADCVVEKGARSSAAGEENRTATCASFPRAIGRARITTIDAVLSAKSGSSLTCFLSAARLLLTKYPQAERSRSELISHK